MSVIPFARTTPLVGEKTVSTDTLARAQRAIDAVVREIGGAPEDTMPAESPHELTEAEVTEALKYLNDACHDPLVAQSLRVFLAGCRRAAAERCGQCFCGLPLSLHFDKHNRWLPCDRDGASA